MYQFCENILKDFGTGWFLDRRSDHVNRDYYSMLGSRKDGIQSLSAYSAFESAIKVPVSKNLLNLKYLSIGFIFNFRYNTQDGVYHTVFRLGNLSLTERNGILYLTTGTSEINTSTELFDACTGKSYFCICEVFDNNLSIEIYSELKVSLNNITIDVLELSDSILIGDLPSGYILSGLFISKNILTNEDKSNYYYYSTLGAVELFLKLNEGTGPIAFDSSEYNNHGAIINYSENCRVVSNYLPDWSNMFGYSTGRYIKSKGVSVISIMGTNYDIEDNYIIPSRLVSTEKDIFNFDLEFKGRVKNKIQLCDIAVISLNGLVLEYVSLEGIIYSKGDLITIAFSLSSNVSDGTLLNINNDLIIYVTSESILSIYVLGEIISYTIVKDDRYLIEIGLESFSLLVGSVILTADIGSTYSNDITVIVFKDFTRGYCSLFSLYNELISEDQKLQWLINSDLPKSTNGFGYCLYPTTRTLIDIVSGKKHLNLLSENYSIERQNLDIYISKGCEFITTSEGKYIRPLMISGSNVIVDDNAIHRSKLTSKEGILSINAFIDMNPYNKRLGFWNDFWNKENKKYWSTLIYTSDSVFKWHLNELQMTYILRVLQSDALNYLFIGSDKELYNNTIREISDLVLLNTGTNWDPKPVPLIY